MLSPSVAQSRLAQKRRGGLFGAAVVSGWAQAAQSAAESD
jgi:hypothetical protein